MKSKFTLFRLFLTLLIVMTCSAQVALAQLYSSGNNLIQGFGVGIGTNTPKESLTIKAVENYRAHPPMLSGKLENPFKVYYFKDVYIPPNSFPISSQTAAPKRGHYTAFFIKWNGRIGIHTNNPLTKLHLHSGVFTFTTGNENEPTSNWQIHGTQNAFAVRNATDNRYDFWINKSNGFVGIGTSSPQTPLHVKGGVMQVETDYGKTSIGAFNAGWSHFNTTLPKFYFNKSIHVNGGVSSHYGLPLILQTGGTSQMHIKTNGQVKIGNTAVASGTHADYKLSVDGKIVSKKVVVTLSNWADEVFDEKYQLRPLAEVEKYINTKKHLPEIPTEQEVITEGVDVGEMNRLLLKKVEELTLYIIELNKEVEKLKK